LLSAKGEPARSTQKQKLDRYFQAGEAYAPAHVLFLRGAHETPEFLGVVAELDRKYPDYAPLRFLKGEVRDLGAMAPTLIRTENFMMLNEAGNRVAVEISAVKVRIGEERAAVVFVDNRTRTIYGQKYVDAKKEELEERVQRYADDVMSNLKSAYQKEAVNAAREGRAYPLAGTTLQKMKKIIGSMTGEA